MQPEDSHEREAGGLEALGWVVPLPGTRAVRITRRGAREMADRFGIVAHT
jgi:hypothetical protein